MQWKLWKRKKDTSSAEQDACDTSKFPLPVNSSEILGLQQLIGNQAVLQIMNRQKAEDCGRTIRRG
jgi:hypothetical protein